jgi:hypothetical protein
MGKFMKYVLVATALCASLLASTSLLAADDDTEASNHSKELDKYYLRVGAFFPVTGKTEVRADTNVLLSAAIDTEQTLGQSTPDVTARIEGYWRYHPKHSLGFVWYRLNQSGSKVLTEELQWDGDIVFLNGEVDSYLDQETIKLDYTYSFYRSSKVELGLSGGLHVTKFDFGISGQADTLDENGDPIGSPAFTSTGFNVTAPLPVVGFKLGYNFTPKTRLLYKTDLFALKFDKYKGNMVDTSILVEYQPWKHVGFGGGLNSVTIQGESDEENATVSIINRVLGAQLYLTLHY